MKRNFRNPLRAQLQWGSALVAALALALSACNSATPTPTTATLTPSTNTAANSASVANAPLPTVDAANTAQQHIDKAKTALKDRRFDVALAEATAATQKDPKSSDAFFVLGNVFNQSAGSDANLDSRQASLNKAIDAYKQAIILKPDNDAAHTNLGTVYYQLGQFDAAKSSAQQALKFKPDDARTHYLLGTIYLQDDPSKKPEVLNQAQTEFDNAIKSEPDLGAAYIGLANVQMFKGDFAGALVNAQKGVDLMKDAPDPFALWALAQAQCKGGSKAAGADTLNKITAMNVPDAQFMQQVQALATQCK